MTMQTLTAPVPALCTRAAERAERHPLHVVAVDWKTPGQLIAALTVRNPDGTEDQKRPFEVIPAAIMDGDESALIWGPYSWLDHLPA